MTRCILAGAMALTIAGKAYSAMPNLLLIEGGVHAPISAPNNFFRDGRGVVESDYRIAQTELTTGDWTEFLNAYAPFIENPLFDVGTVGYAHLPHGEDENGVPIFVNATSSDRTPVLVSWEASARYCNWLHNDRRTDRDAFETGVYDTSTFTTNPDGSPNHQRDPSPGARFWIPTADQWLKAAYFDPDGNDGEGRWWNYPNGSDEPLVIGLPNEGGETNASIGFDPAPITAFEVDAYDHVQSAAGLFSVSGGLSELVAEGNVMGSEAWLLPEIVVPLVDHLHGLSDRYVDPWRAIGTLRLAAAVPSPSSTAAIAALGLLGSVRRRRCR